MPNTTVIFKHFIILFRQLLIVHALNIKDFLIFTRSILQSALLFLFMNSNQVFAEQHIDSDYIVDQVLQNISEAYQKEFRGNGFAIIDPMTKLSRYVPKYFININTASDLIKKEEKLNLNKEDVYFLLKELIEINRKPINLCLKHSLNIKYDYIIDCDSKYKRYFNKNGDGWEELYKENPKVYGVTEISLPVYDEKMKLILIYFGTQFDWLDGEGYLVLYRFYEGRLIELGRKRVWVS